MMESEFSPKSPGSLQLCCYSVAKSCPPLRDHMDYSTPGFPVPHHLLEFSQVHVLCIQLLYKYNRAYDLPDHHQNCSSDVQEAV